MSGVPGDVGVFALRVVFEPILFYFVGFLLFTTVRWVRWDRGLFQASTVGLAVHGLYQYAARVPTPTRWVDATETEHCDPRVLDHRQSQRPGRRAGHRLPGSDRSAALSGSQQDIAVDAGRSAVVIQLGGLAVTFSRGAWVASGLRLGRAAGARLQTVPGARSLAGSARGLCHPGVFVKRFLLIFSGTYLGKAAVDGRTYRWTAALDQIAAHPWFGMGLGTFGGSAADRFDYWALWVDNYYLQMGAEGGLLLLASLLWLLLRVGKGLVKGYRVAGDPFAAGSVCGHVRGVRGDDRGQRVRECLRDAVRRDGILAVGRTGHLGGPVFGPRTRPRSGHVAGLQMKKIRVTSADIAALTRDEFRTQVVESLRGTRATAIAKVNAEFLLSAGRPGVPGLSALHRPQHRRRGRGVVGGTLSDPEDHRASGAQTAADPVAGRLLAR